MKIIKRYIRNHEALMNFLSSIYRVIMLNCVKNRRGLKISRRGVFCKRTKIINSGSENILVIGKASRIINCTFHFFGDGNVVDIANDCMLKDLDLWISDGGKVQIGHNKYFIGQIHIACIEGKTVSIGERCLFSTEITIRTGDSHSILNEKGSRINQGKDIYVGNHVWVGQKVIILKGANIGDESVVGTQALVTGKNFPHNTIIAGSPAKIIKENISWDHRTL